MTRVLPLFVVAALPIAAIVVTAQSVTDPLPRTTAAAARLEPTALEQSTAVLRRFVDEGRVAGAVAMLARDGRLVYSSAVGVQDLETRAPMTGRTLFRIYSMTKAVTAVAVLMLLEERRFALDDPVSKYLPEFADVVVLQADGSTRRPARAPTVRDLLLHTSGMSHRTAAVYRDATVRSRSIDLQQFVRNVVRVPLMEDPGTNYRYSESTTVLGRLVEVWSGQPFDAFLQARVLTPLRMVDTTFVVRPDQRPRLATVYGPADGGLRAVELEDPPFTERPALIEGAVGLVSSASDFLRFGQMLLNRGELDGVRLLKAETVETAVANGLPADVLASRRNGVMGWGLANVDVVMKPEGVRYPAAAGEYGWDGTAGTIFWNDPRANTVIVLMTQSSPADPGGLRQQFKSAIQRAVLP